MKIKPRRFWQILALSFSIFITSSHAASYKILVVGDTNTGKTSFIKRYVYGGFRPFLKNTVGVEFEQKTVIKDNKAASLNFWDIAGQDRFRKLTRAFFQDAHAAFVLLDVTQPNAFGGARNWRAEIAEKVTFNNQPIPVILLASKTDKKDDPEFPVDFESRVAEFSKENGFEAWFGISSKDSTGIDKAMEKMIEILPALPESDLLTDRILNCSDNKVSSDDGCCSY